MVVGVTTSLQTDHYELTMAMASIHEGTADRPCVFSAFARRTDGPFGVVGGVDAAIGAILSFRFTDDDLDALTDVVDADTCDRLAAYRFTGDVEVVDDGELFFPNEPIVTVLGTFADAIVLETIVLSNLNGSAGVATAAARMRAAAGDRVLAEQGSRRVNPDTATEAARAAWIAGFDSSSNLAAGARYGVPTTGTAAHAWTLLHVDDEQAAFEAQLRALGHGTTLLVDTYDIARGIDRAMAAARAVSGQTGPGAVRIDSGDLLAESRTARRQLDAGGATDTRIMVSGEIDVAEIERLADAPVDGFGVGTNVVRTPSPGFVYKLVATDPGDGWTEVAKTSPGKPTTGGRRLVVRGPDGADTVALAPRLPAEDAVLPGRRVVTRTAVRAGRTTGETDTIATTAAARERHRSAVDEWLDTMQAADPAQPGS